MSYHYQIKAHLPNLIKTKIIKKDDNQNIGITPKKKNFKQYLW